MNRRDFARSLATAGLANVPALRFNTPTVQEISPFLTSPQIDGPTPYVIDAADLQRLMEPGQATIGILDVSPLRTYRGTHIPGAIHAFWEDTVDREYPHFGAVVTQGDNQRQRIEFVRGLGLEPGMTVVAYDNQSGYRSARIVWYLRFLGFERVSMLDGGLSAWQEAGHSGQAGVNSAETTHVASVVPQEGYYVVTQQLLDRIESRSPLTVDTRTEDEHDDDLDGALPVGTIPGSIQFPWSGMIDASTNRLRDADQLRLELEQAGLTLDREIVLFARFGVDAALPWLVLKHLGYSSVVTYDRGWVEWASRPDLQRATI